MKTLLFTLTAATGLMLFLGVAFLLHSCYVDRIRVTSRRATA